MKLFLPFCLAIGPLAAAALGGSFRLDMAPAPPEKERVAIEEATHALILSGKDFEKDLPALEKLLASFPTECVDSIGGNIYYSYSDPTRQAAWQALGDWYSVDFLGQVMLTAAYQERNGPVKGESPSPETQRLMARDGVVTRDVLRRWIPALEKLRQAKSVRTSQEATAFITQHGLMVDRQQWLDALQEPDETALNATLMRLIDHVWVDPQLTEEIWQILARSKDDNLTLTCFRYPWLFDLPRWDATKAQLLGHYVETHRGGIGTNVNSALSALARSENPLAQQILDGLPEAKNAGDKKRVAGYRALYAERHPKVGP